MFGYIKPRTGDLYVKEAEFYKAVYCSICIVGGKRVSKLTRFFLNNDFVFLCLVRMAVSGEKPCAVKRMCPYKLKKCQVLEENPSVVFTCAAFAFLMYYKAKDDIADSTGFKKLIKRLTMPFFSHMRKRAMKLFPQLDAELEKLLERLYLLEKQGCSSIDRTADAFAYVTAMICSYGFEDDKKGILSECGYHIGRYVYIIDALDDVVGDSKRNEYNVLLKYFGSVPAVLDASEVLHQTLTDSVNAFCRSYENRRECSYDNLIYNIAQAGSEDAFTRVEEKLRKDSKA